MLGDLPLELSWICAFDPFDRQAECRGIDVEKRSRIH
jgi:hypothetical protein